MIVHKKQLAEDIDQTTTLKELMGAFEEVAALRMRRIREQVLKSREFHELLSHYFHEIRTASERTKPVVTAPSPSQKQLALLISDDKGLYGDILQKTKEDFVRFARDHTDVELAVVGKLEGESLQKALPNRSLQVFSFSSSTPLSEMEQVLAFLAPYTRVTVFHGKFVNLLNQMSQATNLTGDEITAPQEANIRHYFFEPSRDSLLTFFQQEILAVLFEQALLEGTLAKEASRMISLEKATDEAKTRIKKLKRLSRLMHSQQANKKQINSLAGLTLWRIH